VAVKNQLGLWVHELPGRKKSDIAMTLLWTAFIVGLLGSLHCIGMCGPITLALPVFRNAPVSLIFSRLFYNLGRTVTYAFMGGLIGLVGQGISLAGAQQWLSILAGILLILIVFIPSQISSRLSILKPAHHFTTFLKNKFGRLLKRSTVSSTFLIGLINGFLPCGLVYVALAGALAAGGLLEGVLYMAAFGIGTIPLMFVFSLAGQFISVGVRRRFTRLIPTFIIVLGILFILRGLNLGIPYISPKLEGKEQVEAASCH
jgi:sulfite exporter TauE/SafE